MSAEDARPPGRPRDTSVDDGVVEALFELVEENGLGGVTVDGVARRAGVGKATIYRRWPTKEDLLVDAVAGLVGGLEVPESDSIRDVISHIVGRLEAFMSETTAGAVFPWLVGEVASGSDLGRRYAEAVILPGRAAMAKHLGEAVARGELRGDLDVEVAVDMLMGPLILEKLMGSYRQRPEGWAQDLVDALLRGWLAED